jgi:hypothetical protein
VWAIRFLNSIGLRVNDWRLSPWKSDGSGPQCRVWRALTAKHALKERGGLDELARTGEACGFAHYVLVQHTVRLQNFRLL